MKLFGRSGGNYLFWSGAIYFAFGTYCIFVDNICPVWVAQLIWISVICLPFAIPPFGRWLNMSIDWDRKMFDWFNKSSRRNYLDDTRTDMEKIADDMKKVIPFPEPKATPYITPPASEPKTYYTFGMTDDNRVSFTMGYATLTMNSEALQQLTDQFEFYKNLLKEEE